MHDWWEDWYLNNKSIFLSVLFTSHFAAATKMDLVYVGLFRKPPLLVSLKLQTERRVHYPKFDWIE